MIRANLRLMRYWPKDKPTGINHSNFDPYGRAPGDVFEVHKGDHDDGTYTFSCKNGWGYESEWLEDPALDMMFFIDEFSIDESGLVSVTTDNYTAFLPQGAWWELYDTPDRLAIRVSEPDGRSLIAHNFVSGALDYLKGLKPISTAAIEQARRSAPTPAKPYEIPSPREGFHDEEGERGPSEHPPNKIGEKTMSMKTGTAQTAKVIKDQSVEAFSKVATRQAGLSIVEIVARKLDDTKPAMATFLRSPEGQSLALLFTAVAVHFGASSGLIPLNPEYLEDVSEKLIGISLCDLGNHFGDEGRAILFDSYMELAQLQSKLESLGKTKLDFEGQVDSAQEVTSSVVETDITST